MLIWLGVVGTVLALVMSIFVVAVIMLAKRDADAVKSLEKCVASLIDNSVEMVRGIRIERESFVAGLSQSNASHLADLKETDAKLMQAMSHVFDGLTSDFHKQADQAISDWKQVAAAFTKSEQELAENLGALLREVKVSKQLAQGGLAVIEQNVLAIDKLWQMVEMIRTGPRSAAKVQPTEADAAAHEQGLDDAEQQAAIEAQLANAAQRMREIRENFQGV